MRRLLIHVEGPTEEGFVNGVLAHHLLAKGYMVVSARIVGNARLRRRRGGIGSWPSVRRDIVNHLKEDPGCIATTMVDYYGLPQEGAGAWPGRADATRLEALRRAPFVQDALRNDLAIAMEDRFNPERFVPFVVMHEFEGLLFSDCQAFSRAIGRPELEHALRRIRDQFATPEDINDSPVTAPSNVWRMSCRLTRSHSSVSWQHWRSGYLLFARSALISIAGCKTWSPSAGDAANKAWLQLRADASAINSQVTRCGSMGTTAF
ncbi:MAG: DUF4276 family protein [Bryobacteraceae bacterium]